MPLSSNDQLHVLYDIISEHSEDCCGSVSECQQIQRIVQSLQTKNGLSSADLLNNIYSYSKQGESVNDLNQHINNHQSQLTDWANSIQQQLTT